ncbi:MAG: hypothetical protein COB85_06515 [Bacteroidetes bacterium]|nr:MAG: hypothetical protein COB85_06515 [Bacteroidota bacterium]
MMYLRLALVSICILALSCDSNAQSRKKKKRKHESVCVLTVPSTMVWNEEKGPVIQSNCNLLKMEFKIYDRSGTLVYRADTAMFVKPPFYQLDIVREELEEVSKTAIVTGMHSWIANYTVRGAETLEVKSTEGRFTLIK